MKKGSFPSPWRESFFLWSSGGVRRIRRRARPREAAAPPPPRPAVPAPAEQRRYPRLDVRLPILYKVIGDSPSLLPSQVRPYLLARSANLSPIGLCLDLEEELPPGAVVALTIHVPDKRERFSAVGRVVWTRPSAEPGRHLTGLQFVVVEGDGVKRESHSRVESLIRGIAAA